ncbi:hypothetical protein R4Z10_10380 [Niallia sp. XMNu-256]|uniref:hypothetical protein n=1 Tax=Niallia sp. XMNu-256 TaxID=3082444 RepID=UPI0030D1D3AB
MFESFLSTQLEQLIGQDLGVAVGEEMYRGQLVSVTNSVLTLVEASDTYERETRNLLVPLSQVSYLQVNI